jgi:transcriptional regulator with XRE-family HTH domain
LPRPSKISVISYKEIGQRVRGIRLANGLTQAQLAKLLGTSQTALSELERGNRGLTVQQVMKLAKALGVTPNEVLGDGKRERPQKRPRDARVLRRLYRLEQLPEAQRLAVLKVLDGIIEAHAQKSA